MAEKSNDIEATILAFLKWCLVPRAFERFERQAEYGHLMPELSGSLAHDFERKVRDTLAHSFREDALPNTPCIVICNSDHEPAHFTNLQEAFNEYSHLGEWLMIGTESRVGLYRDEDNWNDQFMIK